MGDLIRKDEQMILEDRLILPYMAHQFMVEVTEDEAEALLATGYQIKSLEGETNPGDHYFIMVSVGANMRNSFEQAMAETTGRADVTVVPYPWRVGNQSGNKAYLMSMTARPPA